jgi:hypothetical protein
VKREILLLASQLAVVVAGGAARPHDAPTEHYVEYKFDVESCPDVDWVPLLDEYGELHDEVKSFKPGDRFIFEIDSGEQVEGFIAAIEIMRGHDAEHPGRFPRGILVFDPKMILTRDAAQAMIALGAIINVETPNQFFLALNP